jgi:hypothetical protein
MANQQRAQTSQVWAPWQEMGTTLRLCKVRRMRNNFEPNLDMPLFHKNTMTPASCTYTRSKYQDKTYQDSGWKTSLGKKAFLRERWRTLTGAAQAPHTGTPGKVGIGMQGNAKLQASMAEHLVKQFSAKT